MERVCSKVVPDGTALELSGDVELAPEPERKKVPTATPQKSPTKPEKPPAETKTASAEKPAKEEEEENPRAVTKAPEPAKKSAPKPYKAEWSPPNAKKPEGKRSRSPLATNRATSDASKEQTTPPGYANFPEIVEASLGRGPALLAAVSLILLSFAVLVSYVVVESPLARLQNLLLASLR